MDPAPLVAASARIPDHEQGMTATTVRSPVELNTAMARTSRKSLAVNYFITRPPARATLATAVALFYLMPTLTADLWHRQYSWRAGKVVPSTHLASAHASAGSLVQPTVCGSCLITHGLYVIDASPLLAPAPACEGTLWTPLHAFASEVAALADEGRSPPAFLA